MRQASHPGPVLTIGSYRIRWANEDEIEIVWTPSGNTCLTARIDGGDFESALMLIVAAYDHGRRDERYRAPARATSSSGASNNAE